MWGFGAENQLWEDRRSQISYNRSWRQRFVWSGRIDVTNVAKAYRNLGDKVKDGKPFSEAQIDVDRLRWRADS
jgi:hypothetical protein